MHLEYASDSKKPCTETSCSKTLEHFLAMLGHTGAPARIQCAHARCKQSTTTWNDTWCHSPWQVWATSSQR